MRPRKISKLWYQFAHLLSTPMTAEAMALSLEAQGLIQTLKNSRGEARYTETDLMLSLSPELFLGLITEALNHGLKPTDKE